MKKHVVLFFGLLLSAGLPLCAQKASVPAEIKTGFESIQPTSLKQDLTLLSSDGFEGRMSLTASDQKTIDWIAQQFAAAGLKPAAAEGKPG